MLDNKRIEARIAGRQAAKDVMDLLSWPDGYGADYADAFLSVLRAQLPKRNVDAEKVEELSKQVPIDRLGSEQVEFGRHSGERFDEIPLDYLDWLCRTQEEFYQRLHAYLTHPDLRSRRRD